VTLLFYKNYFSEECDYLNGKLSMCKLVLRLELVLRSSFYRKSKVTHCCENKWNSKLVWTLYQTYLAWDGACAGPGNACK